MKLQPKVAAAIAGLLAVAVVGRMAVGCGSTKGFSISPPAGTVIRLKTFSDSSMKMSGLETRDLQLKTAMNQRLEFTGAPGPTQAIKLSTDSYFVDGSALEVMPMEGVEEAMKSFTVSMAIRSSGEIVSVTPETKGTFSPIVENVLASQLMALQAAGPMGYVLKNPPPSPGESWPITVDLADAVRQSTSDFVTPEEATAQFTFTYVGDETKEGVKVHHLRRIGTGRIKQKLNLQGMPDQTTETTMSSEGDVYVDASTGLLVLLECTDKAAIDFGPIKMEQTTNVTTTGSKAN